MIPRLCRFAVEHMLLLFVGAFIAMAWVNAHPESYYPLVTAIAFVVNDIAMVFFFALITKEVVEATAPDGMLHPWRRATLPVITSIGAVAIPALIHIAFVQAVDEPMFSRAWPIPTAVDVAVSYFVARVIFGQHPVIPFLLLLGISTNAIGLGVVGLFYPTRDLHLVSGAILMAVAIGLAGVLRRARLKKLAGPISSSPAAPCRGGHSIGGLSSCSCPRSGCVHAARGARSGILR